MSVTADFSLGSRDTRFKTDQTRTYVLGKCSGNFFFGPKNHPNRSKKSEENVSLMTTRLTQRYLFSLAEGYGKTRQYLFTPDDEPYYCMIQPYLFSLDGMCYWIYRSAVPFLHWMLVARQLQKVGPAINVSNNVRPIHLRKACDFVDRTLLWEVRARFGVPPRMTTVILMVHDGMRARVQPMAANNHRAQTSASDSVTVAFRPRRCSPSVQPWSM